MWPSFGLKNFKKPKTIAKTAKNQQKLSSLLKKIGVEEHECGMMKGILTCRHTTVRDVMVPRVDVQVIDLSLTKKEIIKEIAVSIHSRFPVYKESIDNILGIVHLRDIFLAITSKKRNFDLLPLINDPFFVPESRLILDVLRDLQKRHLQLAMVVDEYGGFSGVISMEDILEEIIGEVQDEWDDEKQSIVPLSKNEFAIRARVSLKEINEALKISLFDENADTLGGFVINLFGRVPRIGEEISKDDFAYKVRARKGNSLISIRLKRQKNSAPTKE